MIKKEQKKRPFAKQRDVLGGYYDYLVDFLYSLKNIKLEKERMMKKEEKKDLYFFGHHKCATNWVRNFLKHICPIVKYNYRVVGGLQPPDVETKKYKKTFWLFVNSFEEQVCNIPQDARGFHLVRDPRDVIISQYFSWKHSHVNNDHNILETRKYLIENNTQDGLKRLITDNHYVDGLSSWNFDRFPNVLEVKYEDLNADEEKIFAEILSHLDINLPEKKLNEIIKKCNFKSLTKRKKGDEDIHKHLRKGISGDWRNYFNDDLKKIFKNKYNYLLIKYEYEKNEKW